MQTSVHTYVTKPVTSDHSIRITKADGEHEPFSREKLLASLARAGTRKETAERVLSQIERELREGMTTEDIYQYAHSALASLEDVPIAARYSIKRAVFDLGPSGYPFEKFFAEVLRARGWKTQIQVHMTGKCAPHEVDIVAEKERIRAGIEVKFHNSLGIKTDVKDALYVRARFDDLMHASKESDRVDEGWLVTNTRFTKTAIRYGRCSGLILYGWDYPRRRGIQDMIEAFSVHPVTALTTLSKSEKNRLLEHNVVLCKSIKDHPDILSEYGISPSKINSIKDEASRLCSTIDSVNSKLTTHNSL
jgi:Holliday junction resolvase-like predicted endonuclease